ncbi:MAG: DUF2017 domain-containing protein [Terrimesophilobacter sp.]
MRAFTAETGGGVSAEIDRDEALLLQSLASQVTTLLHEGNGTDPAIVRLLPDAYPGDATASAEFRRFTSSGLIDRKVANADTMMATLSPAIESGEVHLDAQQSAAWLRCLTDIRLTLASRLGIESDDQETTDDPVLRDLYDWLGFLQNSLVEALDAHVIEPLAEPPTGDE